MTTFGELFPRDNGMWVLISNTFATEYVSIFGSVQPSLLDTHNALKYSDKPLIGVLSEDNRDTLITDLVGAYINDWVEAAEALKAKYSITELVDVDTTETSSTNDNTYSGTSLGGNKRFDDTNIVDDTRTTDNNTTNIKGATTTTHKSTKQLSDTRKRSLEVFYDKLEHLQLRINKQLINDITLTLWT